ncbi:MAG: hypothetical protein IJT01_09660 [Selenomonadaceae bacterium]|nr:hypothetical protein [Selenomonadaceae bacterium]
MQKIILYGLLAFMCIVSALPLSVAQAAAQAEKIAGSGHQWTGIAISGMGRMFVNFPTWNDYPADYRIAELVDGKEIPYPSMEWNKEFSYHA